MEIKPQEDVFPRHFCHRRADVYALTPRLALKYGRAYWASRDGKPEEGAYSHLDSYKGDSIH